MKEQDRAIVEKLMTVANKNLFKVIDEFESLTGMEFEVASNQDFQTLLNMMHGAVDLVIPMMNAAQEQVKEESECISIQE